MNVFSCITNRQEALNAIRWAGRVFILGILIELQLFLCIKIAFVYFLIATLWLIVLFIFAKLKSRIAAILLFLFSIVGMIILFKNKNILELAHLFTWSIVPIIITLSCAIRAVEATFRLHGKFKDETPINQAVK